jgi:hypothetical protein
MARKKIKKAKWVLLYRKEGYQSVYAYEPLKKGQLKWKLKNGWKEII